MEGSAFALVIETQTRCTRATVSVVFTYLLLEISPYGSVFVELGKYFVPAWSCGFVFLVAAFLFSAFVPRERMEESRAERASQSD